MFRNSFQKTFLTVLFAGGSSPLKIWDRKVVNGHVKRITDEDVRVLVLEMRGTNVATCYIYTPISPSQVLGIRLPFLVMIIKNLKKYFSFEIMILDDRHMRRRFRVSNYQTTTKVRPFGTSMPIGLNPGWNQIQFNLADFTKRAYGSTYVETQRIQIHANCRIRRIYFCDRLYPENELPGEYRLFYPCVEEKEKVEVPCQEAEVPPPSIAEEGEPVFIDEEGYDMIELQPEEFEDMETAERGDAGQELVETEPGVGGSVAALPTVQEEAEEEQGGDEPAEGKGDAKEEDVQEEAEDAPPAEEAPSAADEAPAEEAPAEENNE